jgi:hypothetical protein
MTVSRDDILLFIDWLVRVKGVKGTTINSGIRKLNIVLKRRDRFVNMIIKGKINKDAAEKKKPGESWGDYR